MSLTPGVRLGPYEILAPLGAGGMGEVYRARDTRLDRTVAIKVLPAQFAADAQFRERFEREAKAISQLNHPHICTLYDVGRQEGIDYLVMEHLVGQTLEEQLQTGALPIDQSLQYAIQIADALDKAHRQGIVHRDLKPGNIMLTKSGAKLLDFGLAKATAPAVVGSTLSMLPTTPPMTAQGTIVGTLQYMAPEQLEGKEADQRTDLFAFGAVLYEMLTGKKAFEGTSQATLIGSILRDTPKPVSMVQAGAPPALDRLIAVCLEKDPENRWQTSRDVWRELRWIADGRTGVAVSAHVSSRRMSKGLFWVLGAVAALLVIALAVPTFLYLRGGQETPEMRFEISVPAMPNPAALTVSPDGRWLAFIAAASAETSALFVRPIDSLTAQQLAGTEGSRGVGPGAVGPAGGTGPVGTPFWSPDSRSIAFVAGGRLKKVDVSGGPPENLCDVANFQGGTWSNEGVILFGSNSGLYRVSAAGGEPARITTLDLSQQETAHTAPSFMPDGRHYLYSTMSGQRSSVTYVGSLDSTEKTRILVGQSKAIYAEPGYLLFNREGTLFAQPFDADRIEFTGAPARIADGVAYLVVNTQAAFAVSQSGVLAYRTGSSETSLPSQFQWFDRTGKLLSSAGEQGRYSPHFDLSPDGKLIAVTQGDQTSAGGDIWVLDSTRGVRTRVTFDAPRGVSDGPRDVVWSPDGLRLALSSFKKGNRDIVIKSASGLGEEILLLDSPNREVLEDWSKDGRYILYALDVGPTSTPAQDLYVLPLFGDRKPFPIVRSPFQENEPNFSFDGKWVAYTSNESGSFQVYLISFPALDQKRQISTNGGGQPRWRQDGKELYYLAPDGKLMAVEITTGPKLDSSTPRELFDTGLPVSLLQDQYRATPDGQRFLLLKPVVEVSPTPITVVLNWTAGLKK